MNLDTIPLSIPLVDQTEAAITVHCHLSSENVDRIRETARGLRLTFGDAAVHVGLVTLSEVDAALTAAREAEESRIGVGIIESALKRQSASRSLVARHSGTVKPGPKLTQAHAIDSVRSEQIRALRTALMLLDEGNRQTSVLALLSPSSGEGRSQLAAELAIAFSQLGRRTLLVDADLRNPNQQELFGAWNKWGLAQALALKQAPQLLSIEGLPHLTLLPAGLTIPNPLELLSDGRFSTLISDWRNQYDFVIIDTPPVSKFSDALTIATRAGHVLLCSRAAVTPHKAMKQMLARLGSTQSRILGAVINHF